MRKKVISLVWVGIVSASTCGLFVRWAEAPSLVLAMYRKIFAALALAVPVWIYNRAELKAMTRSQWLWCILSGIFLGIHLPYTLRRCRRPPWQRPRCWPAAR